MVLGDCDDLDNDSFPILVLANKVDAWDPHDDASVFETILFKSLSFFHAQVLLKKAENWCRQNGQIASLRVSAKTGQNVREAFELVAQMSIEYYEASKLKR